jgi:hypothetical protein
MPTLNIEGRSVNVSDDFLKLTPEQQNATVDEIAASFKQQPGAVEDVAKSIPTGLAKGAIGLAGAGGDVRSALSAGVDYAANKLGFSQEQADRFKQLVAQGAELTTPGAVLAVAPSSKDIQSTIEQRTGKFYEPQTRAGRFAETAAEFVPAAVTPELAGGRLASAAKSAIALGVLPGLASEEAGQVTQGGPLEPVARTGAALAAGGVGALLSRPGSVAGAVSKNLGNNVDAAAIARAEQLMTDAQAQGVRLTWAEALEQVAPGAGLTNLQRVVESSKGGREVLSPFFAERPQQVAQAAGRAIDQLGPAAADPSMIGQRVADAADNTIGQTTAAINRASRPFYQAAENQRVGAAVHDALMDDPLYARTLNEVRNNPELNRTIENLPDDSVGVIDLVQRRMRERADNLRIPGEANTSNLAAANFEDARNLPLQVADTVTGSRPGVAGTYEHARAMQQQFRQQYLEPLVNGPIGQASRAKTTERVINAFFPDQPLPNSQGEIGDAVRALVVQNPRTAREMVRAYLDSSFDNAARNLQSGENQFGGAKFANRIAGSAQQRRNLQAAVEALGPGGDRVWDGFERLLDTLEATGKRQPVGSKTSFNTQDLKDLSSGNLAANTVKTGAAPAKWLSVLSDVWSRYQLAGNLGNIANLLIDPRARQTLTQIATQPRGSLGAAILAARALGTTAWNVEQKNQELRRQRQ